MTEPRETDVPLLSLAEVVSLQRQIEAGVLAKEALETGRRIADATAAELVLVERQGEESRQRFIAANLRLVGMVSRRFAGRGVSQADLFQEGCLGLIVAVERFDYARGYRFSTYALFWIRAYIGAATAKQFGAMNLPTSRAEQLRAARGVEAELAQFLGRSPSLAEVAAALGRSENWTADLLSHRRPASIDQLGGPIVEDLRSLEAFDGVHEDRLAVRELLGQLDAVARRVLELRLGFTDGEPRSFAHTARILQLSVNKVRRIEQSALESLRASCPQQASELL